MWYVGFAVSGVSPKDVRHMEEDSGEPCKAFVQSLASLMAVL